MTNEPTATPPDADPPPKLFGWLMEQQEQPDNADVRGAILVEASRLLQEYLRGANHPSGADQSNK